ncbi:MaoC family dehydratase [Actinomycetospora sp. NBRC 106375]|uniref:MaoC family dehydratase n=1 Tax=Actinomycetospora sp. NBRC 106375 TaxID=3032207 RepID=UPI0024A0F826|nr:MaoC family dehydratase [Actinomycetospora sp. NBRC 106375]GLZ49089.1 MaoC family dehydratase [Actinomycetospora sp. NBRC 106375]
MRTFASVGEIVAAQGETLGPGEWMTVDQQTIDTFADATGDHQWIHVDPERAAAGPFGRPIAHGLLTLSLLPVLLSRLYAIENVRMGINYGFNKVRFPAPVPVGARLRATARIAEVTELEGAVQVVFATVLEIEGSDKPACVVESVGRFFI